MFESIINWKNKTIEQKKPIEQKMPLVDAEKLCEGLAGPFEKSNVAAALAELAWKLRDKLSGYDTIISDDASGRLVSLFFRDLIERKKEGAGKGAPLTYFIAAGRHDIKDIHSAIVKFLAEKKDKLGKILLVTEHIETGRSIGLIVDMLVGQGVDFDVASISMANRSEHLLGDAEELKKRLYFGKIGNIGLDFYNKPEWAGVIKDHRSKKPFPDSYKKNYSEFGKSYVQENINKVRKDSHILAERIYDFLKNNANDK